MADPCLKLNSSKGLFTIYQPFSCHFHCFFFFSTLCPPAADLNFLLLETLEKQLPISRVFLLVLSSL